MGTIKTQEITAISASEEYHEQIKRTAEGAQEIIAEYFKEIMADVGKDKAFESVEIAYAFIALGYDVLQYGDGENPEDTYDALCYFAKMWVEEEWRMKTIN